jgi:heterotetrameric sarcosine oxidase delta subunit
MRISCPFCGDRDTSEFSYLGDALRLRTRGDDAARESYEAVYLRDNPAGRHDELWYHGFGCRSWLKVTRDTRTHEIFGVTFAMEDVP